MTGTADRPAVEIEAILGSTAWSGYASSSGGAGTGRSASAYATATRFDAAVAAFRSAANITPVATRNHPPRISMRARVGRIHDALPAASRLLGVPGFDPPTAEGDLIVGPGLIARHRAVFQPSEDGV